jgi:hypothetical protein
MGTPPPDLRCRPSESPRVSRRAGTRWCSGARQARACTAVPYRSSASPSHPSRLVEQLRAPTGTSPPCAVRREALLLGLLPPRARLSIRRSPLADLWVCRWAGRTSSHRCAHVGGAAAFFVLCLLMRKQCRHKRWRNGRHSAACPRLRFGNDQSSAVSVRAVSTPLSVARFFRVASVFPGLPLQCAPNCECSGGMSLRAVLRLRLVARFVLRTSVVPFGRKVFPLEFDGFTLATAECEGDHPADSVSSFTCFGEDHLSVNDGQRFDFDFCRLWRRTTVMGFLVIFSRRSASLRDARRVL